MDDVVGNSFDWASSQTFALVSLRTTVDVAEPEPARAL